MKKKKDKRYTAKRSNVCISGIQEKEESVNGQVKTLSHRFKKLDKALATYIQRKNRPWNIIVKVLKAKHKQKILKAPGNKRHCLQSNIYQMYS